MPCSRSAQPISQCTSVGTDRLTASTLPTSVCQSVVQPTPRSLAIAVAVLSDRSQTETNSERPSPARFEWIRACCRPRWPTPITAVLNPTFYCFPFLIYGNSGLSFPESDYTCILPRLP